jgi:hypothetical protein
LLLGLADQPVEFSARTHLRLGAAVTCRRRHRVVVIEGAPGNDVADEMRAELLEEPIERQQVLLIVGLEGCREVFPVRIVLDLVENDFG